MSHEEIRDGQVGRSSGSGGGSAAGASTWAWATEHGAPQWASTAQLVTWLGRGELPPHTLVWRQGWGEWLPALQVGELAAAFPRVTAGSRRVARAAPSNVALPPAVPIAHYPRLRLLAKDVLSESPLPPAALSRSLVPVRAERRTFRDPDHLQQDVVTSQVPAAAMLEAARAMKQPGAAATRSSAERWGRLELGTFGEPLPAALPPPLLPRPTTGYGRWLLLGALVGSALGLLSVSWPEAVDLAARAGLSLLAPVAAEAASLEPPWGFETRALSLSPRDENVCIAPGDAAESPGMQCDGLSSPGEPRY